MMRVVKLYEEVYKRPGVRRYGLPFGAVDELFVLKAGVEREVTTGRQREYEVVKVYFKPELRK